MGSLLFEGGAGASVRRRWGRSSTSEPLHAVGLRPATTSCASATCATGAGHTNL